MNNITIKRLVSTLDFDVVCLPPDKQIPLHSQSTWELACVITGEGTRLLGDVSEDFFPGDIVLIPPGIPHRWYFNREKTDADGNIENIAIFFTSDLLGNLQVGFPEMYAPMNHIINLKNAVIFLGETRKEIYSILLRMKKETQAKRVLSFLEILLVIVQDKMDRVQSGIRPMNRTETRMTQIKSFVNCNYMHEIKIDEIASHIGMNRTSFCSFFKKETGQTFTKYLKEKRISHACELLENEDMNINEIGHSVGIPDTPYFCRVFKALKGLTPTEYRTGLKRASMDFT